MFALLLSLALIPYPTELKETGGASTAAVTVERDVSLAAEGYRLAVRPEKIVISRATEAGEFYARQTLAQLRRADGSYPCVEIADAPKFKWRGVLLDESRHFFGKDVVKRILDRMAAFKLNVLHWHLVDSHGWRIPIPAYPELTMRGAERPIPDWDPNIRDGQAGGTYGPYSYTRAELEEIVAYAAARHIRIVPEIEIPGHSRAVVLCYPSFSCLAPLKFMDMIRLASEVDKAAALCLGNDEVIRFYETVLDEVLSIFPGDVIHIGGDECPQDNWKACPKCQARMKALGLKSEDGLQRWVTNHFIDYLAKRGRRAIGWDEILGDGLDAGAIVQSWRGAKGGIRAAKAGHEVLMTPYTHCYVDYPTCQPDDRCSYPRFMGKDEKLPIEKVYSFDPLEGIPADQAKFVLGTETLNWTESTWCEADLQYKMWPRTCANAEIAWTGPKVRSFADFKARLDACNGPTQPSRPPQPSPLVIENARFRLTVGADAKVKSLVLKSTGRECVAGREEIPLFTVTQDRPFNNEIKLIHPNKRTTYPANRIQMKVKGEGEGGNLKLVVGFEIAPYEAAVDVKVTDAYVEFKLADFLVDKEDYDYLKMDVPPVASFRVLQLPVLDRKNFGDWLNASWDDTSAIGVVGTSPYPDIDHENRRGFKILTADLVRGQKLKGASAALVAANGREDFLDCMDRLERDFDLPLGVESRRSDAVNAFIYHISEYPFDPGRIDRHIAWAKRGGFTYMTFHIENLTIAKGSWGYHGDYDFSPYFPNGFADIRAMLAKVKAAGIRPGLHFLHPHIGRWSRYVTPVADPRLNKTRRFTLAKPLGADTNATEITVFEPTEGTTMCEPCRILQFGGELVSYESYTTEPPYRFLGVKRGAWDTRVTAHPRGEIGGLLDVSEFGQPGSCYLDQNSDLQEEVAAKIAAFYDCGFEYAYFDGSEGVNAPFNFHVSNAQYRQWKMFKTKPLFSEGAAKTHFGWHILSGANAFDCFEPKLFVKNIIRFPVAQAPISWQDMTRVNFGWWKFFAEGRPDWWNKASTGTKAADWQFACSQCLAWDCPATVLVSLDDVEADRANAEACFEAMRRWETARVRKLLTEEQKLMLRDVRRRFQLDENLELREVGAR